MPTLRTGGSDAVAGSLGDEAPFELRDRAEDMEDQFAGGGGGVDLFFEGEERDLSRLQDLDHLQQFAQRPSEPVEPHHGERIAGTGIIQQRLEAGAIEGSARDHILVGSGGTGRAIFGNSTSAMLIGGAVGGMAGNMTIDRQAQERQFQQTQASQDMAMQRQLDFERQRALQQAQVQRQIEEEQQFADWRRQQGN